MWWVRGENTIVWEKERESICASTSACESVKGEDIEDRVSEKQKIILPFVHVMFLIDRQKKTELCLQFG